VVVVSGLALGIDGEAHVGALEGGGLTVAVLGSGLGQVYPPSHVALGERVERAGALVSEFPPHTRPYKGNFPRRNRVIAGWAPGTVVVEAAARSGALVTARIALEEGREVMAVPGHPSSATSEGANALIRDGAVLVRGAADVAQQLEVALPAPAAPGPEPLLRALRTDAPLSLDELQRRSGVPVNELLQRLGELELERKVQRLPGALFVRGA
jgi:DNA processing protein